jgi:predicted enzyme related to lactoylglutathione lyase
MTSHVDYFEIGTPVPEASRAFYGALFDWSFGEPSMPARYSTIDEKRGGLWDTSHTGGDNWAIFYVQVDDVHAEIDHAQQLGARAAVSVTDNAMIELAHLTDPLGNRFGIWQHKNGQ